MRSLRIPFFVLALHFHCILTAAVFVGADGNSVEVSNPKKIVAINSSTVEILQALGEANRIVGVDRTGLLVLPERRKDLADLGHPYSPNIEGIISLSPDLVIATADSFQKAAAEQLRTAKVPVLLLEESARDGIAGLKRRITAVGALFQKGTETRALNTKIDRQLEELQQANAKIKNKRRVFFLYTHGPGKAFIYGRDTGSHALIELAGGVNAADFTEGTKPLTPEAMVQSAPDALILLERGFKNVNGIEGVLSLPGVDLTTAGKNKAIYIVDDNIRWIGPLFLEHASKLHRQLYPGDYLP